MQLDELHAELSSLQIVIGFANVMRGEEQAEPLHIPSWSETRQHFDEELIVDAEIVDESDEDRDDRELREEYGMRRRG